MPSSVETDPVEDSTQVRAESTLPTRSLSQLNERFTPGVIVADRYRIISRIGEGGMGEVYRADDLKLGQRVALKYVPRSLAHDAASMERLLSEVRIGRQISHPNVCRLYDIAEVDGEHFVAMEFVEGEDLASLLRRIGRMPHDKALAFAFDICAGLAAAHDRGVVHRDLKPANILIDERGTARITDFGLAALAEDAERTREFAGTPVYMAPEQLERGEVSFRSDLYSLGLILYEIYTGRRMFAGQTLEAIRSEHSAPKKRPSSLVKDIDPAVDRVILRCLEENPADRPPSVHAVIAALPGGDPLQAAIAAGETPSPAMVAAAGRVGDLTPAVAWSLLALFTVLLVGGAYLASLYTLPALLGGLKPEPVLEERARAIADATRAPAPRDTSSRWIDDLGYRIWAHKQAQHTLPPGRLLFEYRQSPATLVPTLNTGRVSMDNPSPTLPGMSAVTLDHLGRLVSFMTVPPARSAAVQAARADWTPLLAASGVDRGSLRIVPPEYTPAVACDAREAWSARSAAYPGVPLHIEAASLGGVPVWFTVRGPWAPLGATQDRPRIGDFVQGALEILGVAFALVSARRNILRGRADRRTAKKLFIGVALIDFVATIAVANHVPNVVTEWTLLQILAGRALVVAAFVWACYVAIEPWVRRSWPHMLISWTRLMDGRLRDPMVGRDLLIGGIAGLLPRSMAFVASRIVGEMGLAPPVVTEVGYSSRFGLLWTVGYYLMVTVFFTVGWLLLLFLFRLILRRPLLAAIAFWMAATPVSLYGINIPLELVVGALGSFVLVATLYRFGALALGSAFFFYFLSLQFYSASDLRSVLPLVIISSIVIYGFYTSLAGKPLFGALALEEEPARP